MNRSTTPERMRVGHHSGHTQSYIDTVLQAVEIWVHHKAVSLLRVAGTTDVGMDRTTSHVILSSSVYGLEPASREAFKGSCGAIKHNSRAKTPGQSDDCP